MYPLAGKFFFTLTKDNLLKASNNTGQFLCMSYAVAEDCAISLRENMGYQQPTGADQTNCAITDNT